MASTLATLTQIREHVETDLSDAALEHLVDAADTAILQIAGPHDGERTVELNGGFQDLLLPSPAASISAVSEGSYFEILEAVTVTATEYVVLYGGRVLRRDGTWQPRVSVTYTPVSTNAIRFDALIQLVKLGVEYTPLQIFSDGIYSQTARDYRAERNRILSMVQPKYGVAA